MTYVTPDPYVSLYCAAPMSDAIQIERRKDHRGRLLFVVGMLSTHNEAEAHSLVETGIHEIVCPIARQIAAISIPCPALKKSADIAPNGRGLLDKYPWE